MPTGLPVPKIQRAVQLTGPDQLRLSLEKPVPEPGPGQFLCRVVVVGLCFSDLKLLKQFSNHVRKGEVTGGLDPEILRGFPGYVPGDAPTVPGHEPVVEIAAVGSGVTRFRPGERYFIQADWRWISTASSNAAFGYNFEGALQEYVLLDERLVVSPEGESMLLPAPAGDRSASAYGLVEPWACVEQSYRVRERRELTPGGEWLVVADSPADANALARFFGNGPKPGRITWCGRPEGRPDTATAVESLDALLERSFSDVIYFGHDPARAERLFLLAARRGLILFCLCGGSFGRPVETALGAVHYLGLRLAGTPGSDPADALATIPATGELRAGDTVQVVGAGGPMGVMHVIRDLSMGLPGVTVIATDLSDERLAALDRIAGPCAAERGSAYRSLNSRAAPAPDAVDYCVLMAPIPRLVADAVSRASPGGVVNIFAGIPAEQTGPMDLDRYVRLGLYLIGTSGSLLDDMKVVLSRVRDGTLDTNVSVAAVSGLEGAVDGIRAVERQEVAGKIMVYPACRGLALTRIEALPAEIRDRMRDGVWTLEAENSLLGGYQE
jgi:threonine dehydrogenase-like Zn-dependent dehydrogenase